MGLGTAEDKTIALHWDQFDDTQPMTKGIREFSLLQKDPYVSPKLFAKTRIECRKPKLVAKVRMQIWPVFSAWIIILQSCNI